MIDPGAGLTAATFAPLKDDVFRIGVADAGVTTRLIEIDLLGQGIRDDGGFSLLFLQSDMQAGLLQQGVHTVSHASLGAIDMFLVPVGPYRGGFGYQAVFT